MCRGKNNGDRRCPHDTSEARKRRRRAVQGRELYKQPIFLDPDNQKVLTDNLPVRTFAELKKEAQLIGVLLNAPVDKDPAVQAEIDAKNELLVTRLGAQLSQEAEKRAKFNRKSFDRQYNKMSKDFLAVCDEIAPLRTEEHEARMDLNEAKGSQWGAKKDFVPDPEEVARLQKEYDEINEKYQEVKARWDIQDTLDNVRRAAWEKKTMEKLSKAYLSVIADIRPVGGEFNNHALTSEDAMKTFKETVGKHYPSDWIKASNEAGQMVIENENVRPNYNKMKTYSGEKAQGLAPDIDHSSVYGPQPYIQDMVAKLSEDGDKVEIKGSPFTLQGNSSGPLLSIRFPLRKSFDPETDKMGANGKPEGEGWKYGHVLNDNFEVHGTKQWYKTQPNGKGHIAAITIADSSDPLYRAHAYHEAVHRFEDTLGNGTLTRAETAFLNRRASENGSQKGLTSMVPAADLFEAELTADGGFISTYAGRIYPDQQSKEILSVGAETLFAGRYGGFLGLDHHHGTDTDHRAFVLGMFASA